MKKAELEKRIKYLEAENEWLWFNHIINIEDKAELVEVVQYDKKGKEISYASITFPPKKYRVKRPKEQL